MAQSKSMRFGKLIADEQTMNESVHMWRIPAASQPQKQPESCCQGQKIAQQWLLLDESTAGRLDDWDSALRM